MPPGRFGGSLPPPHRKYSHLCDPVEVSESRPGDVLVRVGAIVFAVGAVATMITVAPLFLGADPLPTFAYVMSMLMGVGFLVAAVGLLRTVAHQRAQARSR